MLKLLRFLKGYRLPAVVGPLFKLMEAVFELILPLVVAQLVDVGIANGDTAYIWKMGGVMIALGAGGLGFATVCQYLAARASLGFGTNVRKNLYRHINSLSAAELDKIGTPSLVTRLTNDVNQTQLGVAMFIRLVLRAPFIAIGAIIMAATIDIKLSLVFVAMAVVVSIVLFLIMTRSTPHYRKIQKQLDEVSLLTRENLSGTRVVRAFSRQDEEMQDFSQATERLAKSNVRVGKIAGLLNPLTYALINLAVIGILWFGGKQVYAGDLTQGEIMALVNYLSQILLALVVTANLLVTFTKASACAGRINEVFALVPSITDEGNTTVSAVEGAPKISFDNVSLAYGRGAGLSLKNLSLDICAGEWVGIIGATGAGKSTVINLLPRFYDATEGAVQIDGVNVRQYPLSQLRGKIGLVPQKTVLFSGTVRDNMLWGGTASDEQIWQALTVAQAADFVRAMPDGLDTVISQGGKNLSGGQRQRLTIARALVVSPEILILDDASSALDYATDAALRAAIRSLPNRPTLLTVSQRATSILGADKIVVLDEGVPVGIGTHTELLTSCPVYREICLSQLSEQEAAAL